MKIKPSYDQETDVPEAHRELFTEQNGKWVLTEVEGIKSMAAVDATLRTERKARQDAETRLKKFASLGERDLDEVLKLADEAEELRTRVTDLEATADSGKAAKPEDEANIQRRIETAVKKREGELTREHAKTQKALDAAKKEADEHKTTATTLDGRIRKSTIETELTKAANDAKVARSALRDVLMYAGVFELGDDGRVTTREGANVTPGLDPASWLSEQRALASHWWEASIGGGARGSDGKGVGGDNPFDKRSPNMSKASDLMRTDPQKALSLARAAGFASPEAAAAEMGRAAAKGA